MQMFNLKYLIKIKIIDFKKSNYLKYKPERKMLFGLFKQKAGIYCTVMGTMRSESPPENYTVIDDVLYVNPRVRMVFMGDVVHEKYFKTMKEAQDFAKRFGHLLTHVN